MATDDHDHQHRAGDYPQTSDEKHVVSAAENTHRDSVAKPGALAADAELVEAIRAENQLTFGQALRLYPKAIGWSAFVSMGVIMLAFDPQLIGNLYATPQFQRDFGYEFEGEVRFPTNPPSPIFRPRN